MHLKYSNDSVHYYEPELPEPEQQTELKNKFLKFVANNAATCMETFEKKNHDYAQDNDMYSNFKYAADFAGVTTEQALRVLIGVKLSRIRELMNSKKEPNNESLNDNILDLQNYQYLWQYYLRSQNEST